MEIAQKRNVVFAAVLVATLGYFVDIYDLILFSVVRVPSLKSLGIGEADILTEGVRLLNLQMIGMLLGGLVFGVLADKFGRLSVLFGSILVYSLANFANGFVHDVESYATLRLIAGFGLAGELGAGITLVSECLPQNRRGLGTTIVASVGISGALVAWIVAHSFDWRAAYIVGGVMGLLLLFLRIGVMESGLFQKTREAGVVRGDLLLLLRKFSRFRRFLGCVLIGLPTWYIVGILVTLSPEFAKVLGVDGAIDGGQGIFYCYSGLIFGDLGSGLLSQLLQSRRKSIATFLVLIATTTAIYFTVHGLSAQSFYWLCFLLGVGGGYWAMFVTISAEQFGTNLRATVATTTPNFARGSLVLMNLGFLALKNDLGILEAGALIGVVAIGAAFVGVLLLRESFHTNLDYDEA